MIIKQKKALSEIVSYTLLIAITVTLSIAVFAWLKFNVIPNTERGECPSDASIVIKDYSCQSKQLTLIIENNGLFNIDGLFVSASNDSSKLPSIGLDIAYSESPICLLPFTGSSQDRCDFTGKFKPNQEINIVFDFTRLNKIERIRAQPYILGKSELLPCKNSVDINLECRI